MNLQETRFFGNVHCYLDDIAQTSVLQGYVYAAPFSLLSVFVDENAARSHCSASIECGLKTTGAHIPAAKWCC